MPQCVILFNCNHLYKLSIVTAEKPVAWGGRCLSRGPDEELGWRLRPLDSPGSFSPGLSATRLQLELALGVQGPECSSQVVRKNFREVTFHLALKERKNLHQGGGLRKAFQRVGREQGGD